ncbi:hypothetical protein [Haloferula sp. BvORR071]|uniref:hypothetical protein n=1 Tax=Haloferula sp. BvORR071 TaxID=1396141 RepID=UPI00054E0948|nr:hypothetical protein [Haloferula sp. BvORR071]
MTRLLQLPPLLAGLPARALPRILEMLVAGFWGLFLIVGCWMLVVALIRFVARKDDIAPGMLASSRVAWCFGTCQILSSILILLAERPALNPFMIWSALQAGLCVMGLSMYWVWKQRLRTRNAADPRLPYEDPPP